MGSTGSELFFVPSILQTNPSILPKGHLGWRALPIQLARMGKKTVCVLFFSAFLT